MNIQERIQMSLLLEKMKENKDAADKFGLVDASILKKEPNKNDSKNDYSFKWLSSGRIVQIIESHLDYSE